MKYFFTLLLAGLCALPALAQTTFSIRGRVLDKVTGETLPGATIQVSGNGQNTGIGADAQGDYKIGNLPSGTYTVTGSFIGYKPLVQTVRISGQNVVATFALSSDDASLEEVQVVATLAQERSTPVAFAAVNEVKLRESLGNRDLPMILNETPGVYATQGGGGTGDSRINIRGFDQRNVAVLVNGVPVNDMENGAVYWSNWDLADVTKSLQVQRGLSASKIAVPSVGGTINVLTKGFDDKRSVLARLETGSVNYRKASLMLSSGPLKNDWAVTFYGSRRTSDGWVEQAYDDAWTYFGNVSKRLGTHRLSLTALGSPQRHGQRAFQQPVSAFSRERAEQIGVDPKTIVGGDYGFAYNPNWGRLVRYTALPPQQVPDPNNPNRTVTIYPRANVQPEEVLNERSNYYHKPQINLNDYWQVNNKLFISTVLYASFGNGGGVSGLTRGNSTTLPLRNGQTDFQGLYNKNVRNFPVATPGRRDTLYDQPRRAEAILVNSVNSHRWYGFVVGGDYLINDKLTLSAGVDGRTYYGLHYREVRDLLGADYAVYAASPTNRNNNDDPNARLGVGDKIGYNYDGKTRWLGGYTQLEYKTPVLSAVVSATLSEISYKRIDYFQAKVLTVGDSTYKLGFGKTENIGGRLYTPNDASFVETPWARYTGYSVKAGANYNLTEHDNLFVNAGYISRVPFFNQVYNVSGLKYPNVRNEGITSAELGYGINYPNLKVMLNAYYTLWANKSTNSVNTAEQIYSTVRNVDARHVGVELSVAQELSRRVQLTSAISLGDWRWTGQGLLTQTDELGFQIPGGAENQPVYLDGVHVGDAAQNQFQLAMRVEPFKGAFIRPSFLLFTKYYAAFNPDNIVDPDSRTDSYRLPTQRNFDLHFGYEVPEAFLKPLLGRAQLSLRSSLLNVFNTYYFTDVSNRSSTNLAPANSINAFFNRGRIFTIGLAATL